MPRASATFGHAVVIGFGHEMNASWYSWGYGHVPPATFIAAWRHIVTLFRSEGADNVTWLWTVNRMSRDRRRSRPGGQAPSMSPGSVSTATTSAPPTLSAPFSADH